MLAEKEVFKNSIKAKVSALLKEENRDEIKMLYQSIRAKIPKEIIRYEDVITFSNYCRADCNFCEYRKSNNSIIRHKLNREEIISKAVQIAEAGANSVLLHSGYDRYYNTDRIAYIIYSLKKNTDLKIGLSFGLREITEYIKWKIAGADSYYLNIITANNELYNSSNSFGSLDERILHINKLKKIGYSVGSGSTIGINNQTLDDIADDIALIKKLDVKHIHFCDISNFRLTNILKKNNFQKIVEATQLIEPNKNVGIYDFGLNIFNNRRG